MGEVGQEWASVENSLGLAGGLTEGKEVGGKNDRGTSGGGSKREGEGGYMGSLSWLVGGGSGQGQGQGQSQGQSQAQGQSQGMDRTPERTPYSSSSFGIDNGYGDKDGQDGKDVSTNQTIFHPPLCSVLSLSS